MKSNRIPGAHDLTRLTHRRRGFTTPAVAVAMLVTMAGLAVMLNRLWLDAADLELTTATESAALAAAGELVTDDLLKITPDPAMRMELALSSAAFVAAQNVVAGVPVVLDTSPQGDVRFGQLLLDSQSNRVRFVETPVNPTTVVVTSMRTRRTSNPVGLFVAGLTQLPFGDVAARVEATVDNRVTGVRPLENVPVPALPIAIWYIDPTGTRTDTWNGQIETGGGADNYGYDAVAHQVTSGPDGIPEIVLHSQAIGQQVTDPNVMVVDLGTGLNDQELARQFSSGWTADDLASFGNEFLLPLGTSQTLQACGELRSGDREALDTLIGQPRICLLYSAVVPNGNVQTACQATCIRLVSIRTLAVNDLGNGGCEVVVQPCIVKTRTAVATAMSPYYTVSETGTATTTTTDNSTSTSMTTTLGLTPNPYIYTVRLTH